MGDTIVQLFRLHASVLIASPQSTRPERFAMQISNAAPGLKGGQMQTQETNQTYGVAPSLFTYTGSVEFNEEKLVAEAKAGSLDAFDRIVSFYEARVFRLALRIASSREDAEDIMQNAFIRAFQNLPQFREASRFYTWLARITINEGPMKVRRRRFNEFSIDVPSDTEDGVLPQEIEDWGPNPEQRYSQEEMQRILATTIDRLAPEYRMVFQLRDVEGFSTEETANTLVLSSSAVRTRLRRARLQLRQSLNKYFKPMRARGIPRIGKTHRRGVS